MDSLDKNSFENGTPSLEDLHQIRLVPEEGYTKEFSQEDNVKKYSCKSCNKVCKSVNGIKHHISSIHTGVSGIKRHSEKKDDIARKTNKKPLIDVSKVNDEGTVTFCKKYLNNHHSEVK